jgi:hypothetical protein
VVYMHGHDSAWHHGGKTEGYRNTLLLLALLYWVERTGKTYKFSLKEPIEGFHFLSWAWKARHGFLSITWQ